MPTEHRIPDHIDPETEIAACEIDLMDLQRDERWSRWLTIGLAAILFALQSVGIVEEQTIYWIFGVVAVLWAVHEIKAEVKRQSIHTRTIILQGYMSSEKQARRRWKALVEESKRSDG